MSTDADVMALGKEIAKVLDEEQVKPPLRLQAWNKIHEAIHAALAAAPAGAPSERHTDRSIPCPTCGFVIRKVERRPLVIEDDEPPSASAPQQ